MIDKKDVKNSKNKYTKEKSLTCMCGKKIKMVDLWSECTNCAPPEKKRKLNESGDDSLKVHICDEPSHLKVIIRSSGSIRSPYENQVLCLNC